MAFTKAASQWPPELSLLDSPEEGRARTGGVQKLCLQGPGPPGLAAETLLGLAQVLTLPQAGECP